MGYYYSFDLHRVWKNILDIFSCNIKKDYQILRIFNTNIFDTTGDQMTVFNFHRTHCLFLHYLGKQNQWNIAFLTYLHVRVSPSSAKADIGEVGTRMVIWWQVVLKMFAPKIIKSCQSLFKLQSTILGCFLTYFCSFLLIIRWFCFPQVVQKQTLGDVEYWTVIWWPVVPKIIVPTIIKIGYSFFKWQSIEFGMFFSGHLVYSIVNYVYQPACLSTLITGTLCSASNSALS